jgi:serine/threonine-protein kinase
MANNNQEPTEIATRNVPSVIGLSEGNARKKLADVGFTNVAVGEPKETKNCKDVVAEQSPSENSPLQIDKTVTINMCTSPDVTRVPSNLIGSTEDAARSALVAANLEPEFKQVNSTVEEGHVVKVEKAGQRVEPGTKITVEISRGNLIEVPSVVGKSEDVARELLQSRGFENIKIQLSDQEGPPGKVVGQTPDAGQKRTKDTEITLTVIAEPDPGASGSPDPGETTPPAGDGGGTGEDGTVGNLLGR